MEIKAHAKFLRLSPKKARYVCKIVQGKKALEAVSELKLLPHKAAKEVVKLLNSALANAQVNFGLSKNDLFIKEIVANAGPTFKRYKPRARGAADVIRKRTTHLSVILVPLSKESKEIEKEKIEKVKETKFEPVLEKVERKTETKEVKKSTEAKGKEIKEKKETKEAVIPEKKTEKEVKLKSKKVVKKVKEKKPLKLEEEKIKKEIKTREEIKRIKEQEIKEKEKFQKKEGLFSGLKRFFRRKGF